MRVATAVAVLLLTACAHVAGPVALEDGVVSDRLFCGLSIPGGGTITDSEIETFVAEVVEPRFPQGFTMWRARGRWQGGSEEVMVLEIVRPHDAQSEKSVAEIADEYRRRFRQEAVLRVTMPARMELR